MPNINQAKLRLVGRARRRRRVRKRVSGVPDRPRLCVFRSNRHIYAQLVDDVTGKTLVSASTLSPEVRELKGEDLRGMKVSRQVGKLLAQRAVEKGLDKVAFDRAGYLYHGRVKALAEGSRDGGLKF